MRKQMNILRKGERLFALTIAMILFFNVFLMNAHAAGATVSWKKDSWLAPIKYSGTPFKVNSATETSAFGFTNYDEGMVIESGPVTARYAVDVTTAAKGAVGVKYSNIGTYNGKKLDLKVTLTDWSIVGTLTDNYNGKVLHPRVLFLRGSMGIETVGLKYITVKYDFFEAGSDTPIKVAGHGTLGDLDGTQFFDFSQSSGIEQVFVAEGNSHLSIVGQRITSSSLHTPEDTSARDGESTILFDGASLTLTFGSQKVIDNNKSSCYKHIYYYISPYCMNGWEPDQPKKTAVSETNDGKSDIKYQVTANMPAAAVGYEYTKWQFEDTLAPCLKTEAAKISVVRLADNVDVTGKFSITIDGQKVTVAAKDIKSLHGYEYTLHLAASVRENYDLSSYLTDDGNYTIHNQAYLVTSNGTLATAKVPVKIPKPVLAIDKKADHYEWKVGEEVVYTVQLSQTKKGAVAWEAVINDISLPSELKLSEGKDAASVSGVEGAVLERSGTGWVVKAPKITDKDKLTVKFKCLASKAVNGTEVVNTVKAAARFADPVQDTEKVWVNSPQLCITKQANKELYKVGDSVTYELHITQNQTGCVARNIVIDDTLAAEGINLKEGSIAIRNAAGKVLKDADLTVKGNTFSIETHRNLVAEGNYSAYDAAGGGWKVQKQWNPLKYTAETEFFVTYEVEILDPKLSGKTIQNIAVVNCDGDIPAKTEKVVPVDDAALVIKKTSDKQTYRVGDTAKYVLEVRQIKDNCTANNVVITDSIRQKDYMTIQPDSIVVKDTAGKLLKNAKVQTGESGFTIQTNADLAHEEVFTVEYTAKITEAALDKVIDNTAAARADNARQTESERKVNVPMEEAQLKITKNSDKKTYKVGDLARYSLVVQQVKEEGKARNVVITDAIKQAEYALIQTDSITVKDGSGKPLANAVIEATNSGYTIHTNANLDYNEKFMVEYSAVITGEAQGNKIDNTALTSADNADKTDTKKTVEVLLDDSELTIEKTSDKETYKVGESAKYTLVIRQTMADRTARNVVITDAIQQTGCALIQTDSIVVKDPSGIPLEKVKVEADEAGFTIYTNANLAYDETFTVEYTSVITEAALEEMIDNVAVARADNADDTDTKRTVSVPVEIGELEIKKTSDKETYKVGDLAAYTLTVRQTREDSTAYSVVVADYFVQKEYAEVLPDTIMVRSSAGQQLENIEIEETEAGFVIYTNADLDYNEILIINYTAKITAEALGKKLDNAAAASADNAEQTEVRKAVDIPDKKIAKTAGITKSSPKTGDVVKVLPYGLAALAAVSAILYFAGRKLKSK